MLYYPSGCALNVHFNRCVNKLFVFLSVCVCIATIIFILLFRIEKNCIHLKLYAVILQAFYSFFLCRFSLHIFISSWLEKCVQFESDRGKQCCMQLLIILSISLVLLIYYYIACIIKTMEKFNFKILSSKKHYFNVYFLSLEHLMLKGNSFR